MEVITDEIGFNSLQENSFIGTIPQFTKSAVKFVGKNNVLFCEPGVKLANSNITFYGDNSLIYLSTSKHVLRLNISVYHNNCFFIGKNVFTNRNLYAICSEQKHIFIGNNCYLSFGIWMRIADPHLIYSIDTKKRINLSKSIYIGDSVWVGQDVLLLKGTRIHSGSIVGGGVQSYPTKKCRLIA